MTTYIAEIAGKDSIAAVCKFMRDNRGTTVVPTIVYTGTEYGDRGSYYDSIEFLRKRAEEYGVTLGETVELEDGGLWNLICAKYQYMINRKYGFHTPCVTCHMFAHIMRLPLIVKYGAEGIITGERFSHRGKLKANQHPVTIECFRRVFDAKGVKFVQPLIDISDTDIVDGLIDNERVIRHANDVKCTLSGNMQGFELTKELDGLVRYLEEFVTPVGTLCTEQMLRDGAANRAMIEERIKEILK